MFDRYKAGNELLNVSVTEAEEIAAVLTAAGVCITDILATDSADQSVIPIRDLKAQGLPLTEPLYLGFRMPGISGIDPAGGVSHVGFHRERRRRFGDWYMIMMARF